MAEDRILDKIKACMELARRSTNPNEAAVALAHAQKLMAKHGISDTELELSAIGMTDANAGAYRETNPAYYHRLISLMKRAFGVKAVLGGWPGWHNKVTFIGVSPNNELAAYAFAVLWPQLVKARSEFIASLSNNCKRTTKTQRGDAFAEGWCHAIYQKVQALLPNEQELELIDRAIAAKFPDLTDSKVRKVDKKRKDVDSAWSAGRIAASGVQLHTPVSGRETAKLSNKGASHG